MNQVSKNHSNMTNAQQNSEVVLSIPEKIFADIIVNFLGKKENLSYEKDSYFIIDLNDVKQFYYLLDEKIKKEQFTFVNYFNVSIGYEDGTKREINTITSLEKFYEARDVIPNSISMTWNIVLKFPNAETIENQKIELLFSITDEIIDGHVKLNIEHTNQSWGIEVLNLFIDNIKKTLVIADEKLSAFKKIKKLVSIDNIEIAFLVFSMLLLFGSFVFLFKVEDKGYSEEKYALIHEIYQLSLQNKISSKELDTSLNTANNFNKDQIEKILQENNFNPNLSNAFNKYLENRQDWNIDSIKQVFIYMASGFFSLIFIRYYYRSYIKFHKNKSFILITHGAKMEQERFISSKNKITFYGISLLVFSVGCSLIASVIYSFISN